MSSAHTVKDICEQVFALEAEHNLLDFEMGGVKIWQYLRMRIYYELARKVGVLDAPHLSRPSLWGRVAGRLSQLRSSLLHNPFIGTRPTDVVVVDGARSSLLAGQWVDVYTHYLLQDFERQGRSYLVLERPYAGGHVRRNSARRKHLDVVLLKAALRERFGRYRPTAAERSRTATIGRALHDAFGVDVGLARHFAYAVFQFQATNRLYRKLLARLRPSIVYVVAAYSYMGALIRAAKDAGSEVVEIQHGVFSRFHLGYSFPGRKTPLAYFPDKLLTWGPFWSDLIEWPIAKDNVLATGFPHFHHMRDTCASMARRPRSILVLSQGAIGRRLADWMASCIDQLDGFTVVYKLHPSEYARWRDYPGLLRLAERPNVTIADRDVDLYRLFAESEYQVGVFSTAVYEGIGMGCRTVLMDLPGVEYMEKLVERNLAVLHRHGESLRDSLARADSLSTTGAHDLFGDAKTAS